MLLAGLAEGFRQSLGYFPALGLEEWSFQHYREILAEPIFWQSLTFSLKFSLISALCSVILGLGLSVMLLAYKPTPSYWLSLPIAIPHIVIAFMFRAVFSQIGKFSRLAGNLKIIGAAGDFPLLVQDPAGLGIIFAYILKQAPYLMAVTYAVIRRLDSHYFDLARSLGAKPWTILRKITLPLARPTLFTAFIILLAFDFGAYELPFLLGPTLPRALPWQVQIAFNETDLSRRPYAMAYTMLLVFFALLLLALAFISYKLLFRQSLRLEEEQGGTAQNLDSALSRPAAGIGRKIYYVLALAFTFLGLYMLIGYSLFGRWPWPDLQAQSFSTHSFQSLFKGENLSILGYSLVFSLLAGILACLFSLPVARFLAYRKSKFNNFLRLLFALPLLIPSTAYYIGLDGLFLQLGLADTEFAVMLGHIITILPYTVFTLSAVWKGFAGYYSEAAASLGAKPWQIMRRVDLPLLAPSIMSVIGLGFNISFGQYFLTLMLGGGRVKTFALVLIPYMESANRRLSAAASLVFIFICGSIYHLGQILLSLRKEWKI